MMTSFMPVWQAIRDGIKGFTIAVNSADIPVAHGFFNPQPETRNPENEPRFPGMVLRTMSPVEGDLIINEPIKCVVTVTAAACFLEGVKAATVALADGQTLVLRVGTEVVGPPRDTVFADQTVVFSSGSFANIAAATPAEIAAVLAAQLTGVTVSVQPGNTVRITHNTLGAYSSLQVVAGTATALRSSFPADDVWGRDAGDEIQIMDPPSFFHIPFQVVTKAARMDHHAMLLAIVNRLFKIRGAPNQRAVAVEGKSYEVRWEAATDDPLASEGLFFTITNFSVRNVPMVDVDAVRPWNGGNPPVGGGLPEQIPIVESFELRIQPVGQLQDLTGHPPATYEVVVVPAP